jgi:hypothetical protein
MPRYAVIQSSPVSLQIARTVQSLPVCRFPFGFHLIHISVNDELFRPQIPIARREHVRIRLSVHLSHLNKTITKKAAIHDQVNDCLLSVF